MSVDLMIALTQAIAAFGVMVAAYLTYSQSRQLIKLSQAIQETDAVREIKSLWHQFDIAVLTGPSELREIVRKYHYRVEDIEFVNRRYMIFMVLNIAQSIFHYQRLKRIPPTFERSQISAVCMILKSELEISTTLLSEEFGHDPEFLEYMKDCMARETRSRC